MPQIHPTAIVHPSAEIAEDAAIGAFTTVEAEVRIGSGCVVGSYATLGERLVLGREVKVFNYACLGTASQDKKHKGERSRAEIGDGTTVREFATVNRATREGGVTRVGKNVLMMAYSHVAHECEVGDGAVLVNGATLGGEVIVEQGAIVSGLACVHQFCRVGRFAMIGANSKVTLDVAPYLIADGHPARPMGANVVGLRRAGFSEAQIVEIKRIYRELFNRRRRLGENLNHIAEKFGSASEASAILRFIRGTRRGLARPRLRGIDLSPAESAAIELSWDPAGGES